MHLNEGKLSLLRSKTERMMWKQVGKKSFGGVVIQPDHCMWNAGVVALPALKSMNIVKMALAICDNMLFLNFIAANAVRDRSKTFLFFERYHEVICFVSRVWGLQTR
jgi:hypothetical protein